jgi:N utilization substance protein B
MKRRLGRELAVQCLYQIEMNAAGVDEALETAFREAKDEEGESGIRFTDETGDEGELREYTRGLVTGTLGHLRKIDDILSACLKGWRMERLSRVDRQVLRLAVYEILEREDVPTKAAVNEAIEIAKHYGTEESGKFVNGVLGQIIRRLDEVKADWQANTDKGDKR